MATYFQVAEAADTALLPKDVRTAADLATIAAAVEREVLQHFTRYVDASQIYSLSPIGDPLLSVPSQATSIGNGYYVFLRGYKEDADDTEVHANLKATLKQVIAEVITWRVLQQKTNKLFESHDKNKFAHDGRQRFPNHWARPLDLFDTRPPTLRI
jgi:hypothetical protein